MSRQVQLLTEEMLGLADKAAEACEREQMLVAERRVNEGRRWLMKALYASDQLHRLTTRDTLKPAPGRNKRRRAEV